jgi:hypothetical protein
VFSFQRISFLGCAFDRVFFAGSTLTQNKFVMAGQIVNFEGQQTPIDQVPSYAKKIDGVWYASRNAMPAALQKKYPYTFVAPSATPALPVSSPSPPPVDTSISLSNTTKTATQRAEQTKAKIQQQTKSCSTC